MLRLPPFRYHRPRELEEALELLERHGEAALPIAGGTDLIPNLKHRLFSPEHLVSLGHIPALRGVQRVQDDDQEAGWISIGAMVTLAELSAHPLVRQRFPWLAAAAGQVAGPQLRNRGTVGGNLCLDTRCTYYNQTEFWREALGFCLKKDGTVCHVTRVGQKCVAAHSADTPPVLLTLDARVELAGPRGTRFVPLSEYFVPDGIWNSRRERDEIITRILIPILAGFQEAPSQRPEGPARGEQAQSGARPGRLVGGYRKLRLRQSIDFPLLSVAVTGWVDPRHHVTGLRGVVSGLGSRPRVLTQWEELARGKRLDDAQVVEALSERAVAQCHPLENLPVDPEWRRAMVGVEVRRALAQAARVT
ncbi:MAG: FAD binding domain-containing protein [Gemmatimonadota bacterium]